MKEQQQKKISEYLIASELLTIKQLEEASNHAQDLEITLIESLVGKGFISDNHMGRVVAEVNGWNFVDLSEESLYHEGAKLIPKDVAKKQQVIVFANTEDGVKVALNDPESITMMHLLSKRFGQRILPYYATVFDIKERISMLYESNVNQEIEKIFAEKDDVDKTDIKENSTVQIVNMLLRRSYQTGASDIHIEPYEEYISIRFRIDGVMQDIITLPKNLQNSLVSRIKIMANLRTDEHNIPQDGKLQFDYESDKVDVRVSVVATTKGENVVLRLLSDQERRVSLDLLGLSDKDLKRLREAIKKPWGMILATGPTGSGKTTTLYTILKILNRKEVNIATIEDPVEFNIDGITQIQVNNKVDFNFASGLKSIVRQDPDIIMVGEIRDTETAETAVNSSMTGHLVLSTLHTNDAATTLPRLLDMGIEPFLVSSTVNIAIGQRLVRKICIKCIQSQEIDLKSLSQDMPASALESLVKSGGGITVYNGKGCSVCNGTGYSGRIGVFEILVVDDAIRRLIMQNADADTIRKKAIEDGMTTMLDDARDKVLNGVTTIEEMLRVIKI